MKTQIVTTAHLKVLASVLLGGALAGAGCASGEKGGANASTDASGAMMCPKCETIWVANISHQGTKIQRLTSEKKMICEDCDEMATAYLKGDKKILHNCPTCKVTPQAVAPTVPSHPKGTHGAY